VEAPKSPVGLAAQAAEQAQLQVLPSRVVGALVARTAAAVVVAVGLAAVAAAHRHSQPIRTLMVVVVVVPDSRRPEPGAF
jgi:ABC-type spermidine/putrescine transport system permease subunit II